MGSAGTTLPTLLLVTGSFALPRFYDPTLKLLPKHVDLVLPHLPTVGEDTDKGRPGPPPTMYDDANFIIEQLQRLVVEQGKDVVLIAHSYGGVPATEALGLAKEKGLIKSDREAKGEKGGVIRVAYMTVLVPEVGKAAATVLDDAPEEDKMHFGVDVSAAAAIFHCIPVLTQPILHYELPY
jgi:pimeloyl-ACP methyl ester carboxylesterase